jgi:molecular chaperone HscB
MFLQMAGASTKSKNKQERWRRYLHHPHKGSTPTPASAAATPGAVESCTGNEQTCWKCKHANTSSSTEPVPVFCNHCGTVQEPCSHCDFFQFFSCPRQFCIDENVLAARYKELQKRLHPDKHVLRPIEERRLFESQSAIVNDAYRTLKEPYRRAAYLLKTLGVDVEGEDGNRAANTSPELLMEVMDVRERIDAASQMQELQDIRREYATKLTQTIDEAARAFDAGDVQHATKLTVQLKYLTKIAEEAENKMEELR